MKPHAYRTLNLRAHLIAAAFAVAAIAILVLSEMR